MRRSGLGVRAGVRVLGFDLQIIDYALCCGTIYRFLRRSYDLNRITERWSLADECLDHFHICWGSQCLAGHIVVRMTDADVNGAFRQRVTPRFMLPNR